jgi:hypothetical protein
MARHPETRKGFETGRTKAPTRPGRPRDANVPTPIASAEPDDEKTAVAGEPIMTPRPPKIPSQPPPRERSAPIQVISMKTPGEIDEDERARVPAVERKKMQVQLRAMSEIAKAPSLGGRTGNLAPPRDPDDDRNRHIRTNVQWLVIGLAVAAIVASLVWLIAR